MLYLIIKGMETGIQYITRLIGVVPIHLDSSNGYIFDYCYNIEYVTIFFFILSFLIYAIWKISNMSDRNPAKDRNFFE